MLRPGQITICGLLAVTFWVLATFYVRLLTFAVTDPILGAIGFLASFPIGWLCVWVTCRLARLAPSQIAAGCMVVIAGAMLIDGAALSWCHTVYSTDEQTCRFAAAWLLWGYGASACVALLLAQRKASRPLPLTVPQASAD
jgi:hypothetical protein